MSNLLYIIAIILLIGWFLGFFYFNFGSLIHILLVIALIANIFRLIRENNFKGSFTHLNPNHGFLKRHQHGLYKNLLGITHLCVGFFSTVLRTV